MKIWLVVFIFIIHSVCGGSFMAPQSSLLPIGKQSSEKQRFEHRKIMEDNTFNIKKDSDEKQDSDVSFASDNDTILYVVLGVGAVILVLPMIAMGVFYLWMLYWFSCGRGWYPGKSFPLVSDILMKENRNLDYLSNVLMMATEEWSDRNFLSRCG